jgi:hypothetical protein
MASGRWPEGASGPAGGKPQPLRPEGDATRTGPHPLTMETPPALRTGGRADRPEGKPPATPRGGRCNPNRAASPHNGDSPAPADRRGKRKGRQGCPCRPRAPTSPAARQGPRRAPRREVEPTGPHPRAQPQAPRSNPPPAANPSAARPGAHPATGPDASQPSTLGTPPAPNPKATQPARMHPADSRPLPRGRRRSADGAPAPGWHRTTAPPPLAGARPALRAAIAQPLPPPPTHRDG